MAVRHDLYLGVYNLISSTMSSYGASTSVITLYGGYPDKTNPTFPAIIIEPIEYNEIGSTKTIDSSRNVSSARSVAIIHIFAKRNQDLDIIADGINIALQTSITGFILNDTQDQSSFIIVNEQKIKGKTLTYTYLHR